jgi:hypothetical protein
MRSKTLSSILTLLAVVVGAGVSAASPADGTIVRTVQIVDKGQASTHFNIVLLAEGYRQAELPVFAQHARAFADFLARTPPFTENCRAINVWRVDVASSNSGADDPVACGGSGARPSTYFDATFCGDGVNSRALIANDGTALDVLNAQVPEWDQALVVVNSSKWGGTGGTVGVTSTASDWEYIAVHELGHSAFGLADEYEYWAGCGIDTYQNYHPPSEPAAPNVTIQTDRNQLKWSHLILGSTPLPTTSNANCSLCDPQPNPFPTRTVVGLYEGADYYHCDAFRPAFNCMMRNLVPFCPVCSERIEWTLSSFDRLPLCDAGGSYVAECAGPTTQVRLDGSGSSSLECGKLSYLWSGEFLEGTASGATPTVTFGGPGIYGVALDISAGPRDWDRRSCGQFVAIQDTRAPLVEAPPDVDACTLLPDIGTATAFDACASSVSFINDAPSVFPLGETFVHWTGTDASATPHGDAAGHRPRADGHDTAELTVSLSQRCSRLRAKLVGITAHIVGRDLCDMTPAVRLVSLVSNEPLGRGGRRGSPDIVGATPGTDDRAFLLRARRDLTGNGRVYTATYEIVDDAGNKTTRQATVSVPRPRR